MSDKEKAIAELATGCAELGYAIDCFKKAEKAVARAGLNQKIKYPVGNVVREFELWKVTQSFDKILKGFYDYLNNLRENEQ